MIIKIYSFLSVILSVIIFPLFFITRKIQKKDVTSWKIKLGGYKLPSDYDKNKKTVVVHGVSVGEVISLEKMIRRIKNTYSNVNLVVTTGTKTGQETAHKKTDDIADFITYFPFDTTFAVKKFLDTIRPDVILIAETEIWPNFAYNCNKRNIPLFIINGRISDESYKSYKFLKPFFKNVLPLYTGIFTQSTIDKERLKVLGANPDTLEVMKNLKFDVEKINVDIDIKKENSKVLIAGSTHKGEDEIVLDTYKKLKTKHPNLKLLLAPRHLTRCDDVIELVKNYNFTFNLYSKDAGFYDKEVLILDVMGELAKLYSVSDVAFIGGSFNQTGGHNPLEAIIFNKPVISGPSIKNFRDIYSILSIAKAAFVVNDKEEFYNIADKLLSNKEFYEETVKNTQDVFNNQQGALDFIIEKLNGYLV